MSARTFLFALLLLIAAPLLQAAPPVSRQSAGWFTLPSPTSWLPAVPGLSPSKEKEGPSLQRATTGAWRSVTGSVRRGWRWTASTLNPWSDGGQTKSSRNSEGFWQQLFASPAEREVETVTDFLAQPKPY